METSLAHFIYKKGYQGDGLWVDQTVGEYSTVNIYTNKGLSTSHSQIEEEKGNEKGGREHVLKFSSWQALIFHHSN